MITQSLFIVNRKHVLRIRTGCAHSPNDGSSQPLRQRGAHWNIEHRGPYLYALHLSFIFQKVLQLLAYFWNSVSLHHSLDPQSQI